MRWTKGRDGGREVEADISSAKSSTRLAEITTVARKISTSIPISLHLQPLLSSRMSAYLRWGGRQRYEVTLKSSCRFIHSVTRGVEAQRAKMVHMRSFYSSSHSLKLYDF